MRRKKKRKKKQGKIETEYLKMEKKIEHQATRSKTKQVKQKEKNIESRMKFEKRKGQNKFKEEI